MFDIFINSMPDQVFHLADFLVSLTEGPGWEAIVEPLRSAIESFAAARDEHEVFALGFATYNALKNIAGNFTADFKTVFTTMFGTVASRFDQTEFDGFISLMAQRKLQDFYAKENYDTNFYTYYATDEGSPILRYIAGRTYLTLLLASKANDALANHLSEIEEIADYVKSLDSTIVDLGDRISNEL